MNFEMQVWPVAGPQPGFADPADHLAALDLVESLQRDLAFRQVYVRDVDPDRSDRGSATLIRLHDMDGLIMQ